MIRIHSGFIPLGLIFLSVVTYAQSTPNNLVVWGR